MKLIHKHKLSKFLAVAGFSLGLHAAAQAQEVAVDTELLLLVDVSGSVDSSEYRLTIDGYSEAFRSQSVVDSIQSGSIGSIAVSLLFWSGATQQVVGVAWSQIDSLQSSIDFADSILDAGANRPFSGRTAIGSALEYGATTFGTETGNVANGFNSVAQVIDISGDGVDNDTPPSTDRALNVRNARDAAIASGVDAINGLPIGNAGGDLEGYYAANVIAGSAGGVAAFTQAAATFADIEQSLNFKLQREIEAGAVASIEAAKITASSVPEPSSTLLISIAGMLLIIRRRK